MSDYDPSPSFSDNYPPGPCHGTCVLWMVFIFVSLFVVVIIPVTVLGVLGCCIFRNKIFYLCSWLRRGVGAIMTALRGIFEKLFEYRRRPRPPPSPVQHESGSRWLHSPEKMWLWLQQRIRIARMELREKLSVFGQLLRPRPTLPPVQHAPGSRWPKSPQKVWIWIQERMEMTRTELRERLSSFGQLLRLRPKPYQVTNELGSP